LAIAEFGDNPFSIWNITKTIRKNVRNGEYELKHYLDDVPHDMVKEYFTELLDGGILNDYYVRNNPSGYREFAKTMPTNVPSTTPVDPTTIVQSAMATTVLPTDVQVKIYNYMKNNGPVSMKKIQSRLKGYNYTCSEIKDFLDKINLVDPQSSAYPTSQAWTVRI